jgi:hypothetical protein
MSSPFPQPVISVVVVSVSAIHIVVVVVSAISRIMGISIGRCMFVEYCGYSIAIAIAIAIDVLCLVGALRFV